VVEYGEGRLLLNGKQANLSRAEANAAVKTFSAPWSGRLKAMSAPVTVICLFVAISGAMHGGRGMPVKAFLFSEVAPFAVMAGAALFMVRGYAITPDAILVERLLWYTRLPRAGLESATFSPEAIRGSVRTWGNGGFLSFTGMFWNRELGNYRAFVTDHARIVVLRYAERKPIVISPGEPEEFVREVMEVGTVRF
jgi:hypothetical protein